MRKTLLLAGILIVAGTARAQNVGGSVNGMGNLNHMGSLNGGSLHLADPNAPSAATDFAVNRDSRNPGTFEPSTFTSYGEAVELGKLEAAMKPVTLAEAARLAQAQKKNANKQNVIVVDRTDDGKLVIAPATK